MGKRICGIRQVMLSLQFGEDGTVAITSKEIPGPAMEELADELVCSGYAMEGKVDGNRIRLESIDGWMCLWSGLENAIRDKLTSMGYEPEFTPPLTFPHKQ